MSNMEKKSQIMAEAKKRVKKICFGDPVTNISASTSNPSWHCHFVEYIVKKHKNKYGIIHKEHLARCTKRGKYWNIGIEFIYPGHLGLNESDTLFDPVWQANFGT